MISRCEGTVDHVVEVVNTIDVIDTVNVVNGTNTTNLVDIVKVVEIVVSWRINGGQTVETVKRREEIGVRSENREVS